MDATPPSGVRADRTGPPPPFDPELAAALGVIGEHMDALLSLDDIPAIRGSEIMARLSDEDLRQEGAFEVEERTVAGPSGEPDISLLICRPAGAGTALPALYHIHGGGMILGDNRSGLASLLDWARELNLVVVSVEYRPAPEHPHPAPVEDAYAGLLWTSEHAGELGIDPGRIIVAGGSAGGGLAAAVALLARDRGGPAVPVLELPASAAAARTALRFTAEGTDRDPGPRTVYADKLGGLALPAGSVGPDTEPIPDVRALDRAIAAAPWAAGTIHTVAYATSLRAAAELNMHHSTLQDRLAQAEHWLGRPVHDPRGRLRLQLALALWRLHRNLHR
ncbi:alpha/beta hydrolase [Streptomyces scopuliridis]|uniref:alpha/beta hydrolase n=1 Tax=Streptomyces scopuliridis TaxID=452529 RepID=UPI003685D8BC